MFHVFLPTWVQPKTLLHAGFWFEEDGEERQHVLYITQVLG